MFGWSIHLKIHSKDELLDVKLGNNESTECNKGCNSSEIMYMHKGLGIFFGTNGVIPFDILFAAGILDNLLFGRDEIQVRASLDSR